MALGATDYLTKPLDVRTFLEAIFRSLLAEKPTG